MLNLDPAVLALQITAFIVLFLVLRKFLFGPLLGLLGALLTYSLVRTLRARKT